MAHKKYSSLLVKRVDLILVIDHKALVAETFWRQSQPIPVHLASHPRQGRGDSPAKFGGPRESYSRKESGQSLRCN